jgi:hypothetical protein
MMTQIYDLDFEIDIDGSINLEQECGLGEVSRITLHPIHLRLLAEEVGLVPTSDPEANRTIARLSRQMRTLLQRIGQLDDWLNAAAQRGHEDLQDECTYSLATWELAREWAAELPEVVSDSVQRAAKQGTRMVETAPKTVPLNGPESGAVRKAAQTTSEEAQQ